MKKPLIIAALLIGAGSLYANQQYKLLMNYGINYVGYKILKLSISRIIIEVKFKIKNRSDIDVLVTSFDFNIFLNGVYATKVKSSKQQIIKAKGFSTITLLVDVEPTKNKELSKWSFLQKALSDIRGIKVKTSGTISAKALGVSVKNQQLDIEMPLRDMLPDNKNPSPTCI